jgi:hypothetical protein
MRSLPFGLAAACAAAVAVLAPTTPASADTPPIPDGVNYCDPAPCPLPVVTHHHNDDDPDLPHGNIYVYRVTL